MLTLHVVKKFHPNVCNFNLCKHSRRSKTTSQEIIANQEMFKCQPDVLTHSVNWCSRILQQKNMGGWSNWAKLVCLITKKVKWFCWAISWYCQAALAWEKSNVPNLLPYQFCCTSSALPDILVLRDHQFYMVFVSLMVWNKLPTQARLWLW